MARTRRNKIQDKKDAKDNEKSASKNAHRNENVEQDGNSVNNSKAKAVTKWKSVESPLTPEKTVKRKTIDKRVKVNQQRGKGRKCPGEFC